MSLLMVLFIRVDDHVIVVCLIVVAVFYVVVVVVVVSVLCFLLMYICDMIAFIFQLNSTEKGSFRLIRLVELGMHVRTVCAWQAWSSNLMDAAGTRSALPVIF